MSMEPEDFTPLKFPVFLFSVWMLPFPVTPVPVITSQEVIDNVAAIRIESFFIVLFEGLLISKIQTSINFLTSQAND